MKVRGSGCRFYAVFFVLGIFCGLAGLGSGCGGTEAGNPSVSVAAAPAGASSGTVSSQPVTAATEILSTLCSRLHACITSLNVDQCALDLGNTAGFGAALGVTSNGSATFSVLNSSEESGSLTVSASALAQCTSDISALSCSAVSAVYSTSTPNDFSRVPNLIPASSTSCRGVY